MVKFQPWKKVAVLQYILRGIFSEEIFEATHSCFTKLLVGAHLKYSNTQLSNLCLKQTNKIL